MIVRLGNTNSHAVWSMVTLVFQLWFSRYNRIWHWRCVILFMLCFNTCYDCHFSLVMYWNCFVWGRLCFIFTPVEMFNSQLSLIFFRPLWYLWSVKWPCPLSWARLPHPPSNSRIFPEKTETKNKESFTARALVTEINGILPTECSGTWIQSLHPSHPRKGFPAGSGF